MADVIDIESQLQQIREQQRAAMSKQTPAQPTVRFDERLKEALFSTNTVLRNQAATAGTSVSASSVLANASAASVRAGRANTKSTSMSSKAATSAPSGGASSPNAKSTSSSIATTSSALTSSPNAVAGNLNSSPSVAGVGSVSAGGTDAALTGSGTNNTASAQLLQATQTMQEMNQTFNLQYLQLQENMQAENRQFSAVSNVMKLKQDTAKNSLSNLK